MIICFGNRLKGGVSLHLVVIREAPFRNVVNVYGREGGAGGG